jgi:hypothetical protein
MRGHALQFAADVGMDVNAVWLLPSKVLLEPRYGIPPGLTGNPGVLNRVPEQHQPVLFFLVHTGLLIPRNDTHCGTVDTRPPRRPLGGGLTRTPPAGARRPDAVLRC